MRLFILWSLWFYSFNHGFSQTNLPDWMAARSSPASVGYALSVVIPDS
jgi:hypothetical protein